MLTRNSLTARLWLAAAILLPLWLTLPGDPAAALAADRTPWYCISCGPGGTADLFQNTLLLVPLGLGLALIGWPFRRSALLLLLLPVGIELTQGLMATGRDAALGDVLANAMGGMLGWFAGRERSRLLWPESNRAAPLVWGIFVAQLLAAAILNRPSPVGPEPWALRLVPEVPGRPTYLGAVDLLTLGGSNILADPHAETQHDDETSGALAARFTWNPASDRLPGTIARLDDRREWAIFSIDRRADAVAMTLRTMGARLRLREPTWQITMPSDIAPGDTVTATLRVAVGSAVMTLASAG
ncbi:MAG TPA: VanZ family protein, partial [Gemmatimonadales bacterium]|nr:VanZ family protein [Gemmatimonadales bacterium]